MSFLERDIKYGISKKKSKELRKLREQQKESSKKKNSSGLSSIKSISDSVPYVKKKGRRPDKKKQVSILSHSNKGNGNASLTNKPYISQVDIQTKQYKTDRSKVYRSKKDAEKLNAGKKDDKLFNQMSSGKSGDRFVNTVKGTSKQIGGQYLNAAVTPFANSKISSAKVEAQNDLGGAGVRKNIARSNSRKYDTTYSKTKKQVEQEKQKQLALKKQTQQMQKNFEQGVKQTQGDASALRQSGAKDVEKAKEGLSGFGKFGIDLASQMMMWGSDAAIGAATGTGLLTPMFVRSFGDASMTARESGATHGQQMFAGLASGSIEAATEKLFSPYKIMKKTAGAGFADNLVEKASYKLAGKIATKLAKNGVPSNALYKAVKNTVKAGSGMVEEGLEEVLADLAQPLYERSYDKDSLKQYGTKEYWQNVGRDFGMGAAMAGVLGGSSGIINKARGSNSNADTNQPYTEKEKSQAIKAAKAQGEETQAYKYALELETQQKNGKEVLDAQVDDLAQKTFQEQYETQKAIIEQQERTERTKMAAMQEMAGETDSFMNDHMTNIEAQAVNEVISRRVGNNASRIAENLVNVFHADPEIAASQAESIARIKTGTATAADLNVGAVTNIEARSVLQRELKTKLPATNAETIKKLAEYAGTARAVQKPGILKEARQSARAEMFQVFTQGMDDTTADIFSDGMEKVQIADMPKYMEAFATYYQGGRVNYAYDKIPIAKQYKGYITESIKMAAYNAGNQIYQAEQVQAAEAQKNIVKGERRNGSLEISDKNIKKIGKEQANALRMMTEVAGKKIVVLDQIDAGSRKDVANGKYQDGTIYISAKSKAPVFDVLKHELTHNLQETAPEAYNELKQYVFRKFYESDSQKYDVMVHNMIERYAKGGVELTRVQAEDELLADATDVFFKDADAIQDLVNENRSLGEKLLDGIRSLLDTLHRMATGSYSDEKIESKGEWLEAIGIVEEAERLWVKALNESIGVDAKENSKTKYSFAGISAQNADNKMLSVAKAMASKNESSEKIRKETGWHKGHDGKWRFEIDDSQMEVFTAGDAQFRKGHPEYVRLQELYDKFWDSNISDGEQKELRQLEDTWGDEYGRLHERLRSGDARLGDILRHDRLFENYPFLENIRVRLENIAGENAHYNPGRNEIVINKDLFESSYKNEQRNTTLIHEIQHAIQQMESFASGANPDYYQDKTTKRIEDLKTRIASKEIILSGREDGLLDTVDRMGFDSDEMNMEKLHQEIYDFLNESGRSDLVEFAKETFETKAKELDGLRVELRDLEKSAPAEMYTNTAGEVEARDAGKRAGMSASERKETRPDIDNDVVFAEDFAQYQLKDQEIKPFEMSKKQVLDNMKSVAGMKPVATLTGNEFAKGSVDLITQVSDFFDEIGNTATNSTLGEVTLNRRGVKASVGHGIGRLKAVAFGAVPAVIGKGQIIDAQHDWKGRGYDTIVIAAPVRIGDSDYYVGAIIERQSAKYQEYYLHEVVVIKKNSMPKTGTLARNPGSNTAPIYNLLQQLNNVNNLTEKDIVSDEGKFQLKDENEQLRKQLSAEKELSKKLKAEFKRSKYATPDPKQSGKAVNKLIETYLGKRDARLHQSIMQDIEQVYKEMRKTEGNWNLVDDLCRNVADKIVSNMEILHDDMWNQYTDLRKTLRSTTIKLSEAYWNDIADFEDLRKSHFGTVKLSKQNGVSIDTFYQELAETYPELFDAAEYTNEVDQLYNILDVVDSMKPYTEDYSSGEIAEFADSIAKDVLQMSYDLAQKKTFADIKFEEKQKAVEKVKAERNSMMQKQKERYERRLERQSIEYKQKESERRQKKQEEALRSKLLQLTRRLKKVKTDKATRAYIDSVIGELDTVAKGMRDGTRLNLEQLRDKYEELKANDPDFLRNKDIEAKISRLEKKQIHDMDIRDVRELVETMSMIEHGIRISNRLIQQEDRREVRKIAEDTVNRMQKVEGSKAGRLGSIYDGYISWSLSPLREFRRLVGYDEKSPLYRTAVALNEGQLKMNEFIMRGSKLFDQFTSDRKWIKRFTGDHAEIITKQFGYKTVKYTPAMRVSLYLHSLNDENLKHIKVGGVRIPNWKLYKAGKISEAYARGERVTLTPSEVRTITDEMTPKEKAFAEQAKVFFNQVSQSAINETSLALDGIEKALVDNYFPIVSDERFTNNDFESLIKDGTIEGMGMLKERKYSGNPVVLEDVTSVVNRQLQNIGKYYGLAIPVRNFNKLYNQSVLEFHDDGSYSYRDSVKDTLENKWGGKATKYIENLLTDMQNGRQTDNTWLDRARGSYAQAVLALNVSVTMKQAASYPTAAAVLGYGPLVKAMAHPGKLNHTLVDQYTPLLWYRSKGYRDTELGDIVSRGNLNSKAPAIMGWIQKVDMLTVGKLWKASEIYVRDNYKNLEYRSDLFYKKTAEVFNRVTEETQPNYTVMQRPDILRTTNQGLRAITMFSTQRMQNFNILYDALGNLRAKRTEYRDVKSIENKRNLREAEKEVVKASTSQLIAAGTIVAMTFIAAATLHGLKRYDDDKDGEIALDEILGGMKKDFLDTIAGTFLFGSDVYSFVNHLITGETYYGVNNASLEIINDTTDSVSRLRTRIEKAIKGEASVKSVLFQAKEFTKTCSKMLGIPLENAEKILLSPMKFILEKRYGKYVAEYMELQWQFDESEDSDDAKSKFGALYKKALKAGETEQAYTIKSMMEDGGLDEKYINGRTSDVYSDEFAEAIESNDADSIQEAAEKLVDAGIDEEAVEKKVKAALGSACNEALKDDDIGTAYDVLATMEEYGLEYEYIKRKKRDIAVYEIASYISAGRMDRAYADAYDYHSRYNWEVNALIERAKKLAYGV